MPSFAQSNQPVSLTVGTQGDQISLDPTQLTAKPGQTIHLTFRNNASAGSRLQHAWVLLKPGAEGKIADAATSAGADKGFIPDSPDVLAHTRLLNPGESQTITFKAPATPGSYPYICPFPGHAVTMKGTLDVK